MGGKPDDHRGSAGRDGQRSQDADVLSLFIAIYQHFELTDAPPPAAAEHGHDSTGEAAAPYAPPLRPLPSGIKRFLYRAGRDELYSTLLQVLTRLAKMERE